MPEGPSEALPGQVDRRSRCRSAPGPRLSMRALVFWAAACGVAGLPSPIRKRTFSRSLKLVFSRAPAAARTFSISGRATSSNRSETAPVGFATKSTAPRRNASSVASAPVRRHRRHHDHRAGSLDHDPVEASEPVHFRHVNVEGDNVRAAQSLSQRALRARFGRTGPRNRFASKTPGRSVSGRARSRRQRVF